MALNYITLVLDLADGTGTPLATGQALLNPSAQLTDATDDMIVTKAQLSATLAGSYPQVRLLATDTPPCAFRMGVDGLFPRDAGEPSAVHVLPPGQPLLFHRDQRQPGRVHCRWQLLCQQHAGHAHRAVAARRVRWRAGGFHLAAVEDAKYEPVMPFINHSCEPNVGFATSAPARN